MAGTGQIKCVDPKCKGGGANGMCVTTGKDDEPIARTLAIEMQNCARYTEKTLPKSHTKTKQAPARNAWIENINATGFLCHGSGPGPMLDKQKWTMNSAGQISQTSSKGSKYPPPPPPPPPLLC